MKLLGFARPIVVTAISATLLTTFTAFAAPEAGAASERREPRLGVVMEHTFSSLHGAQLTLTIRKHRDGGRYFLRATCELSGGEGRHLRMRSCWLFSSSGRASGTALVADGYDHVMGRSGNFTYKCSFTYRVKAAYVIGDSRRKAISRAYDPC
ncbi:hypothetical protein [Nonomuraea pusilla]|uniref:Uncharacterized protein n=1 Tax=Nonomuraea pusilla TaxID=46177 RepID=A0A1H7J7L3_9ACTN|nr:hypothetical protein [Nonomuraea pusilla]SEK69165.1 hypothetical protein SAMN05660976_01009 [Nonomuraea pusilla]